MYLYLASFNLRLFLCVQLSNQPPIINTYLNISKCLCSIRSKRLSCMNVESCFWKSVDFILYVFNVLWNKWNKKKMKNGFCIVKFEAIFSVFFHVLCKTNNFKILLIKPGNNKGSTDLQMVLKTCIRRNIEIFIPLQI